MASLFDPLAVKGVTLRNRIVASPMCQYQARDGLLNEWRQAHYTMLARGGAGLVIVEATAVTPEGRITPGDAGLWSNEHVPGFAAVAASIKAAGSVPGIQIGHAGRKAGCNPPWEGGAPLERSDPQAWTPVAPSALPYVPGSDYVPAELTQEQILVTQQDFVDAAVRARQAGFEWLELHFAHGFLGQAFLQLLKWAKEAGLDLVDVGLALTSANDPVPWGPNFMVPYAERVRLETGLLVATSWMITDPKEADAFVREHKLDLVFFARTLLANPHWPFHAARELGIDKPEAVLPTPYAFWLQNWSA